MLTNITAPTISQQIYVSITLHALNLHNVRFNYISVKLGAKKKKKYNHCLKWFWSRFSPQIMKRIPG